MERNFYYCPYCQEATPQIEVPLREIAAHEGNDIESYALAIDDFLGTKIKKTYTDLVGNRYWKCGKCLRIYRRDIRGEIIAQVHTSVESYYTPSQSKQNKVSSNSINFNTFEVVIYDPTGTSAPKNIGRQWKLTSVKDIHSMWDGGGFSHREPRYTITLLNEKAKQSFNERDKMLKLVRYALPQGMTLDGDDLKKVLQNEGYIKIQNLTELQVIYIEDRLQEYGLSFNKDYTIEGL